MKKAEASKAERGRHKLYPEGVDIGITFPRLFKYFDPERGLWPGSEKETYALFRFFDKHREVGLTFVFGETNFCLVPPGADRKGESDLGRIKVPKKWPAH